MAIQLSPNNAVLYADRAQANIKLNNFTEAVADANKAIDLNPSTSKAYFRKGHEFYQKSDEVVVTIFAKGIPRDSVTVDFVDGGQRPTYPSSKLKRVDWDKLEAQVKKELESNGTVLSTNWKEVGSKKVEGSPLMAWS
ncbi:hypothetical protein Lal_00047085 [Lupinus albus]|nr:hypothetical protein Lal_00047085 [Lupinus albus]